MNNYKTTSLSSARPSLQRGQVPVWQLGLFAAVLAVAWLLWSGLYKPLLFGLGTVSVVVTLIFATRMKFFEHTSGLAKMAIRLPGYWFWLLIEIVKSAIQVSRIVLSPSLPIEPTLVKLTAENDQELPQVILGNSITLSPGTITIDIDESEVLVHCISAEGAKDMESGVLLDKIAKLRKG